MSMLLDPRGVQSMPMGGFPNAGQPSIMDAPQVPQQQMQQANFGQRFKQNMGPILQALGMGIASNNLAAGTAVLPGLVDRRKEQNMQQQQMAQEQQRLNATYEWAKTQDPEVADMIAKGIIDPNTGFKLIQERRQAKTQGAEFFGNPIYGTGPDGKPRVGQLGKDGSIKWVDTGEVTLSTGVDKIDAGTHWVLQDKRSGQSLGTIQKDLRGAESEKAIGAGQGEAAVAAPKDAQAAQNALTLIESIRSDPAKSVGTGLSSVGNQIPGSAGRGFAAKVEQAKSGAFLTAIQQMRGMGQLSNAEGATATAAVTRMQTSLSEADFDAALADYEKIVRQALTRAQTTMGGGAATPQKPISEMTDEELEALANGQ
jgi:hypothetical protein